MNPPTPSPPSILDFFTIGVGPSSSHTVGPMRAARTFALALARQAHGTDVHRITVALRGSLGATGQGHGTDRAIVAGLEGHTPERVDPQQLETRIDEIVAGSKLCPIGGRPLAFVPDRDLDFDSRSLGSWHNGMTFEAVDAEGALLHTWSAWSVGGGFVHDPAAKVEPAASVPFPFWTGQGLLDACVARGGSVADVVRANEDAHRPWGQTQARLDAVVDAMQASIHRGERVDGTLPGPLGLQRRAPQLLAGRDATDGDEFQEMERLAGAAIAVSEENAAGQRVVTAPTNGAAGIVPSVLDHALRRPGATRDTAITFLLTAGAIAWLCKHNASISGAEVGCQGEVGSACAMAAAGLAAVSGASPAQVENAAEIALEHNLGLSCDPVAGLVQVPCIERNGVGAVKAVVAARLALRGDGHHRVSLDQVLATVRSTGADMSQAYKETSTGGLALNVTVC